ncbi:MAG TPA: serine/threonine-protein kinase [Frankiaceae bacterium]|nr:serine/threonine-protein kinase [Frankiaceae bacterium]
MTVQPPQTGERVAHYALQARLATGGMGVIYRAFDERTKRLVALKVLSPQFGNDPDYRARFAYEAELAARVEHPNIVPIYDVGGFPNLYIAMRLVPGTDLASVLRDGPLHPERALDVAESVAGALDEAHRNQLVHRDVKPGNVLLAPTRDRHRSEHVYLTDFGIARSLGSELRLTRPVVVLGSPAYMAPERLAGEPGGPGCDVYGLGCVLFECFTGQRPWPQNAPPEEINRRQSVDPPRLAVLRPDLPRGLDEALHRAMARDPRQRPATAGDLAAACRSAFSSATPPLPANGSPSRVTAPYQRPGQFGSETAPRPPAGPPGLRPPPVGPPPVGPPHAGPPHAGPPPAGPRPVDPASAGGRRRRRRWLLPLILAVLVIGGAITGGILASRVGSNSRETTATRALEARLPANVYGTCAAVKSAAGARATVACSGRDARVDHLEVIQVTGAATLADRFRALSADRGLVTRRCADETGNSGGFWTRDGTRQGDFACYVDAGNRRRVLWQYDAQALEVQAIGRDDSATSARDLYAWWTTVARNGVIAG